MVICPEQKLILMTYSITNSSNKTLHPIVNITQTGVIPYTVYVRKECHCAFDIMIVGADKVKTVLFSKS